MATTAQEKAVRNYLIALRDPSTLRDDALITKLQDKLETTSDEVERVRLRQQLLDAQRPQIDGHEAAFTEHAKAWAESHGITAAAFEAEGVPGEVLRRAGFSVARSRGRKAGGRTRSRVTTEQVRDAIPRGTFTIKDLQQRSGASPAVVRKVVQEGVSEGTLKDVGTDDSHSGPGRAPRLYRKGK